MIKFIPVIIDIVMVIFFSHAASLFSVKLFKIEASLRSLSGITTYAIAVLVGVGFWLAAAPILNVNANVERILAYFQREADFGPGIEDFRTSALRKVKVYNGPALNHESWFILDRGDVVYVETLVDGFCNINEVEKHWVPCDALAPPPQGWENSRIKPSMNYENR